MGQACFVETRKQQNVSFAFYNLINLLNFADINVRLTWYIYFIFENSLKQNWS